MPEPGRSRQVVLADEGSEVTIDRASYQRIYSNAYRHGKQEALRAALPAEPPSALMSAIHMTIEHETGIQINTPISQVIWRMVRAHLLGEDA